MRFKLKSSDFHESYYEHSCAVVSERDVLDTDIRGHSCLAKLKRWWYDLFLLSYTDQRSRIYHTSCYSMRKDRQLHYRKLRGRIHPLSKFRNFWDSFMLLVFMSNMLTFHHNTSFIFSELYPSFYFIGAGLEVIIIIDLFVNLATGYIDSQARKIVLNKYLGVMRYCSTKLFLHTASALPLQWLLFIRYGKEFDCTLCKISKFICVIEVLSIFNLLRLYQATSYWTRPRSNFIYSYFLKFLRISIIGLFTMLQFIELADKFTLRMMLAKGSIAENSYVALLLRYRYATSKYADPFLFFIFDFARICKSILLFSFAYRRMNYYQDRMVSLLAYMIANVIYLWHVIECFTFIAQMKFPEDRMMVLQNSMINMVRCRQLPDKVTEKLITYYEFNCSKRKAVETRNHMYRTLPLVLKQEQHLACYSWFLARVVYFVGWPTNIKNDLIHLMTEEIYLAQDLIAEPWAQSEGLSILAAGELAVYSGDKEMGHLIDGDYFGELSLVTDKEISKSTIIALTPCMLLIIRKASFRRYMRAHPNLFFKMKHQLKKRYAGSGSVASI